MEDIEIAIKEQQEYRKTYFGGNHPPNIVPLFNSFKEYEFVIFDKLVIEDEQVVHKYKTDFTIEAKDIELVLKLGIEELRKLNK
tara:strand:+ start:439 stop:690 length:252 start_codon:yes stop_codon:yes gene_type:complete